MAELSSFEQVDISQLRTPYSTSFFTEDQLVSRTNPFKQFHAWFQLVLECDQISEPNAVSISTATKDGRPSSRMVLMKSYSERGFTFFTNYRSRKGRELEENPNAALLFYWPPLHQQVRIEGTVQMLPEEESTEYFHSRPRESQISAVVSPQSEQIPNRGVLEAKHWELVEKDDLPIPRPQNWGGYLLIPTLFEFWQGQSNRLHDRIVFMKDEGSETWTLKRLAP